jgi:hypothetical protein
MNDDAKDQPEDDFHISHFHESKCDNPDAVANMMRAMHGPQGVDQSLRQAVSMCWMMLPEGQKTVDSVEREIRRLVDRILADLREDAKAFGIPEKA